MSIIRYIILPILASTIPTISSAKMCDGRDRISLEQLNGMFRSIDDKTDWNMSQPMLWGYFFTDSGDTDLAGAKSTLQQLGYTFVSLRHTDGWQLHMERIEVHTPESLFRRNEELYEFARRYNIDCYDGMDVGLVN